MLQSIFYKLYSLNSFQVRNFKSKKRKTHNSSFLIEGLSDNPEEEWEDVESGDECDIEMETEVKEDEISVNSSSQSIGQDIRSLLYETRIIDSLLNTILNDNENLFIDTNQLDHISNRYLLIIAMKIYYK